jgi:hypothetical protein
LYSTPIYYYIQRQLAIVYTGSSPRRYQNVYAKQLKLNKGADNRIQFQFLNQEQKPVDITGKEITFRIISKDDTTILLQASLTPVLALTGIAEIRITSDILTTIPAQIASYSIQLPDDIGYNVSAYVDSSLGGRGTIEIVDSVLPSYVPSSVITINTNNVTSNITDSNGNVSGQYYSFVFSTNFDRQTTFQIPIDTYTGNIVIQGSIDGTSDWYEINTLDYSDANAPYTLTDSTTVVGYHPFIKFQFNGSATIANNTLNSIGNILAR